MDLFRFGDLPSIIYERKLEHVVEDIARKMDEEMGHGFELNMEGCTSRRKLIQRPKEGESGSGRAYEVKPLRDKNWRSSVRCGVEELEEEICSSFLMLHNRLMTNLVILNNEHLFSYSFCG